jgi:uncharacterized protein
MPAGISAPGSAGRGTSRKWLRRLHAWCGLALAGLFILFALTGFLLNHRAVMKIPALDRQEVRQVLPLASPAVSADALAAQLAESFGIPQAAWRIRIEPGRLVDWASGPVDQPARWLISAETPSESMQAEYWAGSRQVEVRRVRPNLWLYLARLHMAIGTGPAWVLLADAVALGLGFLGLSGFWLWGRLHGSRRRLIWLASGGVALTASLAWVAG